MKLTFTKRDRVLFIAPHPDDESLATGGLIQRAVKSGAAVRVLFATNGDNNPWPQRWDEKRLFIGIKERRRWGARRREEARAACQRLGVPEHAVDSLHFPDQGITAKLLRSEPEAMARLCGELADWQPSVLVMPSAHDLHPDHNALHVLLEIAIQRVGMPGLRRIEFLVHTRNPELVPRRMELHLSDEERQIKREAILCHHTQMVLSRKRFVAYAKPSEVFFDPAPVLELMDGHRIREAFVSGGALNLIVTLPPRRWDGSVLFIAVESLADGSARWKISLPLLSRRVWVRDAGSSEALRSATVRIGGQFAIVKIPLASVQPVSRIFVKLHRRRIFLDEVGWREVPLAEHPVPTLKAPGKRRIAPTRPGSR